MKAFATITREQYDAMICSGAIPDGVVVRVITADEPLPMPGDDFITGGMVYKIVRRMFNYDVKGDLLVVAQAEPK